MATEKAVLGGGCFWCVEAAFLQLEGVESVVSGYMGGTVKNPSYEQVCTGTTGHAESLRIYFDPQKTSLEKILEVFWEAHDPTSLNRQGADSGTQYRSAIFYYTDAQKAVAEKAKAAASGASAQPAESTTPNPEIGFHYSDARIARPATAPLAACDVNVAPPTSATDIS